MGNIVVESIRTKNMIGGWDLGYLSDQTGAESASTTAFRTDYIPVDFTTIPTYCLSGTPSSSYSHFVCAYNSSKQFLGRTGVATASLRTMNSGSFSGGTAQGTGEIKYLRVTIYNGVPESALSSVQLEQGGSQTTFTPSKSLGYTSGSNANGNYIKYDDGTLIQWGTLNKSLFLLTTDTYTTVQGIKFYRSSGYTLYTPAIFVDMNYTILVQPLLGYTSGASRLTTSRTQKVTDGSFDIQLIGVEAFTSSGNGYVNLLGVDWIAIGRWK